MNKRDSPFVLRQFLHRVKLLGVKVEEDTEDTDTLPHLILITILKAEVTAQGLPKYVPNICEVCIAAVLHHL